MSSLAFQIYGYQGIKSGKSSENLVGRFASQASSPVVIGSKFFTVPWTNALVGGGFRLGRKSLIDALRASLKRLNRQQVDLYQVSFVTVLPLCEEDRPLQSTSVQIHMKSASGCHIRLDIQYAPCCFDPTIHCEVPAALNIGCWCTEQAFSCTCPDCCTIWILH